MCDINGSYLTYGCRTWRPLPMLTLPSTFDESLSYYEQICQIVAQINKLTEQINNIGTGFLLDAKMYTDSQITLIRNELTDEIVRINTSLTEFYTNIHELENMYLEFTEDVSRQLNEMEYRLQLFILNHIADKLPLLINPWNGNYQTIQEIFDFIPTAIHNSLTAVEYDRMMLTAGEYAEKRVTAENYIKYGRWIFLKEIYMRMWNPFTGERTSQEQVIHMLADLHKDALTAAEYDALNLTASEYDGHNLSAHEYDWMGKSILT